VFSGYSSLLRPAPDSSLGYALDWPRRDSSLFSFARLAENDLAKFQKSMRGRAPSLDQLAPRPAIFPMVQSGVLGIREEEQCLQKLFDLFDSGSLSGNTRVELTSGYFALYGAYQDRILSSKAHYRVLAASPEVSR
jgi:CDP-diacylglycerol--glycerol-3-phosphate 3-phosphatidyltransferase